MKIMGIAVDAVEDGFEANVRIFVPAGEEVDGRADVGSAVAAAVEVIKESENASSSSTSSDEGSGGRRRRGRKSSDDEGEASADADASSEDKPARRRRRSKDDDDSGSEGEDEKPKGRRRRRSKDEDEGSDEGESKGGRRRRRSASKDEADEGLTAADVVKACSEYANKLSPKVVKEILKDEFEVDVASDIPADKRQRLLDILAYEAEETDEAPEGYGDEG